MTASTAANSCTRDDDCKTRTTDTNANTETASISINTKDAVSDHTVYLTLGDGDFTYSLDLVRYFTSSSSSSSSSSSLSTSVPRTRPLKLILSGIDSFETLTSKYTDTPNILDEIRKQQEKMPSILVSIRHGVNAIVHKNSSHNVGVVVDKTVEDDCSICTAADHVLFQHPHLGTENCSLHKRFLAHLFHSATNHWMKRNGGIFHLTLVEGQYDRWECQEQAKRHGLILLHQAPFTPPPISHHSKKNDDILDSNSTNGNVDLNCNRYHYRRHQTGKSFASRRPKSTSTTYTFGRTTDKSMYVATALPWQQSGCSSSTNAAGETVVTKPSSSITKIQTTSTSKSTLLCPFCGKEFLEERSRKCHIHDKHPNEVPIDDRSKQPRKKRQKKEETSISTPGDDGHPSIFCPHCQDSISADESSRRRIFQSAKALETHIRAKHSAIYTYIAPDWSIVKQKEKNNNNTDNHEQTNNRDNDDDSNVADKTKVEECHICGLKLVGRSFTQHLQDFVPIEGLETFSCQFCSKTFREERAKLQHTNFCSKRPVSS